MSLPKIINDIESRVKDTGDIIKGQLDINWPYMSFDNQHGAFHVNDWEFNIYAKKPEQGEDHTRFMISNPYVSDDSGLLRVNSIKDGETTSYKVYGEHNKPSSTALGFVKGNGYSTLITIWDQLGLSTGSITSVKQIVEKMPTESAAILACDVVLKNNGVTPSSYGLLKIFKANNSYSSCEFTASDSAENWIGYYNATSGNGIYWSGWMTSLDNNNYNKYAPSLTGAGATGYWGGIEVPKSRLLSKFTMNHDPENRAGYRLILSKSVTAWRNYRAVLGISSRHTGNGMVCLAFGCNSNEVSDNTAYGEITYYGSANVGLTASGGISNSGGVFSKDMFLLYYNNSNKTFYLFAKYYDYNTVEITLLGHQTSGGDYIIITDFINGEFGTTISTSTYGRLVCQTNKGWSEGDTMTAPTGTDYTTVRTRNIAANTSLSTPANGNVFLVYT